MNTRQEKSPVADRAKANEKKGRKGLGTGIPDPSIVDLTKYVKIAKEKRPYRKNGNVYEYVQEYWYLVASAEKRLKVERWRNVKRPKEDKIFWQFRWTGKRWESGLDDYTKENLPLWLLPELLEYNPRSWVYLVEGEKSCLSLLGLQVMATTKSGGVYSDWLPGYTETLRDRKVCYIADNDKAGRDYTGIIRQALAGVAKLKIIEFDRPAGDDRYDITDWINDGGTRSELEQLRNNAQIETPQVAQQVFFSGNGKQPNGTKKPQKQLDPNLTMAQLEAYTTPEGKGSKARCAPCPNYPLNCNADDDGFVFFPKGGNYFCRQCDINGFAIDAPESDDMEIEQLNQIFGPGEIDTSETDDNEPVSDSVPAAMDTSYTPGWIGMRKTLNAFGRSEVGDAELLVQLRTNQICYDVDRGQWFLWTGQHWGQDKKAQVNRFVFNEVASQYLYASAKKRASGDDEMSKTLASRAGILRSLHRISNVLKLASSQSEFAILGEQWDTDPYLLGVENGVIDLRDGSLRHGKPDDYIQATTPTKWEGLDKQAPRWEQFISEIFGGDNELVSFVQRLLGYGMSGLSVEHILVVAHGPDGRNGKDTLFSTLGKVLGVELAGPAASEVLLGNRNAGSGPTPSLYDLRFRRLVWCSETSEGARLDGSQVKLITGGAPFSARPLYGKPEVITPKYMLCLQTNYKPHLSSEDEALWERLILLPFSQRFIDDPQEENEHQRDKHLKDKMENEGPGILAWLVRGFLDWQEVGLNPPDVVKLAVEEYRTDEDDIGRFIEERCDEGEAKQVIASELYSDYRAWALAGGVTRPMTATAFGRRMTKRGYEKYKSGFVYYLGLDLSVENMNNYLDELPTSDM